MSIKKIKRTQQEKEKSKFLKEEFHRLLDELGWSLKKFSEEINNPQEDINQTYERVKKDLQRDTTHPRRIQIYINDIQRHKDYQKLLKNRLVPSPDEFIGKDKLILEAVIEICKHN